MYTSTRLLLSIFCILLLVSCSSPTPTSVHPTDTPIPIVTDTPQSTNTSTPAMTPTMSESPSSTAETFTMGSQISPNGEYTAYSYFYYGTEQQTVEIKDKEDKVIWQIAFQGELPHSDPRTTIGVYRWSNDSSQLYFCYYWSPDGGDIFIRESCSRLQALDIKTGEIRLIVPEGYTAFDVSHDESQIAYLNCDESCTIHIQNLLTGSEKTATVLTNSKDYIAIGGIFWSPSDKGLVFHTQDKDYIMLQTIYLDTSIMKLRLIKKYAVPLSQNEWAAFDGWVDDNTLKFIESGKENVQVVYLDINSNESIVIGTPTPSY